MSARLKQHEELGLTTLWVLTGLAVWQTYARWRGIRLNATLGWVFFVVTLVGSGLLLEAVYFAVN